MPLPFFIATAALQALGAAGAAAAGAAGAATAAGAVGAAAAGAAGAVTAAGVAATYGIGNNFIKDFLTTDEAVLVLGMSKPTLLRKLKEGLIPYDGEGGRGGFRISRQALEEYAKSKNKTLNWEALKNSDKAKTDLNKDKKAVIEMIKLKEIQKEEAELELEELELDANDSIDYKRNLIQAKKNIKALDREIQSWKMLLQTVEDEPFE